MYVSKSSKYDILLNNALDETFVNGFNSYSDEVHSNNEQTIINPLNQSDVIEHYRYVSELPLSRYNEEFKHMLRIGSVILYNTFEDSDLNVSRRKTIKTDIAVDKDGHFDCCTIEEFQYEGDNLTLEIERNGTIVSLFHGDFERINTIRGLKPNIRIDIKDNSGGKIESYSSFSEAHESKLYPLICSVDIALVNSIRRYVRENTDQIGIIPPVVGLHTPDYDNAVD